MSGLDPMPGSAAAGPHSAQALPRRVGRRVLLKLLAKGGMGEVYLATTLGLDGAERPQVVKTVRRDHLHDGSFLARFLDEARVQAQLNHPSVVQVIEAGTDEHGEPFTVFEHVEGRSLAEVRARAAQLGTRISWPDAVAIALEMAHGLSHVHERVGSDGKPLGIVHRDLSPQNVMIGYAGEVKLIDFGTARGENRRCHTVAGVVFAKPGYVAPEIARHEVGDGRIDLYALGVMLWEMAAGRRLLEGDPQRHLEEVAEGKFTASRLAARLGAPADFDEVIQKLTANLPADRYSSAAHAATDLARLLMRAPTGPAGERSVRARIGAMMKSLFVSEPARSRSEFARLLLSTKDLLVDEVQPTPTRAEASDDPSLFPGTSYRLGAKIGEGASGVVHEAEHIELGRPVALKILNPQASNSPEALQRFRREARAVAQLSHPNIAFLHDFGRTSDQRVFLAMELLSGRTLGAELQRREQAGEPFSAEQTVELAAAVAGALSAAHQAGIVHRDLKPDNLFLTEAGTIKLLDFGIALAKSDVKGEQNPQRGFAIFGTPEYMAPEQIRGDEVDAGCDLYALGCVVYEMLTGSRPFSGTSSVVVMTKHLREQPVAPSERTPERRIPAALDAVVLKCMAKDPRQRYASAQELEGALRAALQPPKSARRPLNRSMWAAAALAVTLPLATFGALRFHAEHTEAPSANAVNLAVPAAPAVGHPEREIVAEASPSPSSHANATARTSLPRLQMPAHDEATEATRPRSIESLPTLAQSASQGRAQRPQATTTASAPRAAVARSSSAKPSASEPKLASATKASPAKPNATGSQADAKLTKASVAKPSAASSQTDAKLTKASVTKPSAASSQADAKPTKASATKPAAPAPRKPEPPRAAKDSKQAKAEPATERGRARNGR